MGVSFDNKSKFYNFELNRRALNNNKLNINHGEHTHYWGLRTCMRVSDTLNLVVLGKKKKKKNMTQHFN